MDENINHVLFCRKCGAQTTDDSMFCPKCGESIQPGVAQSTVGTAYQTPAPVNNKPRCPRCGSSNLQVVMSQDTSATGGGYSGGKGCLGFLLFGPLGLLCGSCGSKTKIESSNRTGLVCIDCGSEVQRANASADLSIGSSSSNHEANIFTILLAIAIISGLAGWGCLFAPSYMGALLAFMVCGVFSYASFRIKNR